MLIPRFLKKSEAYAFMCRNKGQFTSGELDRLVKIHDALPTDEVFESRLAKRRKLTEEMVVAWKKVCSLTANPGEQERRFAGVLAGMLGDDCEGKRRRIVMLYAACGFRCVNREAVRILVRVQGVDERFKELQKLTASSAGRKVS